MYRKETQSKTSPAITREDKLLRIEKGRLTC